MMWVKTTPALVEEWYLRLSSWQRWMKLLEIDKNCSHSPIIFLNSLLVVLSKTIGQNDLVESYNILFGLGMIIVVDVLKWDGQWSKLIQVLAIFINLLMHSSSFTMVLRWLVRCSSHWDGSLQNGLRDKQTCETTLASAYVLCRLSAAWLQLQMKERKSEWKWVLIGVLLLNTRDWVQ